MKNTPASTEPKSELAVTIKAKIKALLPEIEEQRAEGVPFREIYDVLMELGLGCAFSSFTTTYFKLRQAA